MANKQTKAQAGPAEIGSRPEFRQFIQENVDRIREQRKNAVLEHGYRLKRHTFDRLEEQGLLKVETLMAEFQRIATRESKLSSAERALVSAIVMNAAEKTVLVMRREEEKQNAAGKAENKPRVAPEKKSGTDTRPARKRSTSAKSAENKPEE